MVCRPTPSGVNWCRNSAHSTRYGSLCDKPREKDPVQEMAQGTHQDWVVDIYKGMSPGGP